MIVVVGLSHQNAPIEVRERIALPRERLPEFLTKLVSLEPVGEAMVISTCNRVELVAAARNVPGELKAVADCCVSALEKEAPGITPHVYRRLGGDAVRHLFRVASSLDSLVLGEPQILGQVKDAFDLARSAGTVRSILHRSVPRALRTAKRVRSETSIGSGQVSVPSVAVDLTRQIFGELRGRTVLLVGSGEMAETVAKLLRGAGTRLLVLGRTRERVEELAKSVDGEPRLWPDLRASLVEADVVITSTSAPSTVIDYDLVAAVRKQRRGRSQTFIDLAVPRDVEPRCNGIDGVFLYNVDDFSRVVAETLSSRSREAELADRIVEEETRGYERWADAEQATPTIVKLRALVRDALSVELSRSLRGRLKHLGAEERDAIERMLDAAENRLLHAPTMRLREAALTREAEALSLDELVQALNELFDFDGLDARAETSDPQASPKDPAEKPELAAAQATGTSGPWSSTR
ncbi:MAG TPA: glutamyl-tRNA reductase [Polyangiaceae bacterium]|nr:glutamyl-tRNA reductase [Polyangiaceae bacterium]